MEAISRPEVKFIDVHDGDTYWFMVNWKADKTMPWFGAEILLLRLRDYGARELRDTAPVDPKKLNRVDGPSARNLAYNVLLTAESICAEFHGLTDFSNPVVWIWVDGLSLGEVLYVQGAVAPTKTMGV